MRRLAVFVAFAARSSGAFCQPAPVVSAPAVIEAQAPAGGEALGVDWRIVESQGVGSLLLAVARPAGDGPFPAVVILHGSHGFAREYAQLAQDLARTGVIAVAACWFAPGSGPGVRFVSPLTCPTTAPPMSPHLSPLATRTIDAIVDATRTLPDVQADRIALFGHSRGGGAAWNYVLRGGHVQAVILNSAGYPDEVVRRASQIDPPVLILHGERDGLNSGDGGSPMTDVRRARAFEQALRKAGKQVQVNYYRDAGHNGLFSSSSQNAQEVREIGRFLHHHFRKSGEGR